MVPLHLQLIMMVQLDMSELPISQMTEDMYRHPDRISEIQRKAQKRLMKQNFWDVYAQGEALDIFSGKKQ